MAAGNTKKLSGPCDNIAELDKHTRYFYTCVLLSFLVSAAMGMMRLATQGQCLVA